MTSIDTSENFWTSWPPDARLKLLAALRKRVWEHRARPEQLPPPGDWRAWYIQGGRGSGKTRTGAETLAGWILESPPGEWAVIAPTYGDARDVCVEAEGGLLAALAGTVEDWNRSTGHIRVANGSRVYLDGADDGALRIQGKNLRGSWCDEIGLWARGWKRAWEESLQFAVRLAPGRIVATGTPKAGHGLVKLLLANDRTVVTRMRTIDNAENLHPAALDELMRMYEGKRLGRQELDAEFLEDVEGALWTRDQLEEVRIDAAAVPPLERVVVAIDPNVSSGEAANAAGIIVAGKDRRQVGYVLEDCTTVVGGPREWARIAIAAYHRHQADRLVAEKNQGGEMVALTLHAVDPTVPVKLVSATRGKRTRAEPIAALYEGETPQVLHAGRFPALEDEMVTWVPDGLGSDDRLDALVWALTELNLWAAPQGRSRITVPHRLGGAQPSTYDYMGHSSSAVRPHG